MIRTTLKDFGNSIRETLRNWQTLAAIALLFALGLGGVYLFASTREATFKQVGLTFALVIAIPVLFLALQTMIVKFALGGTGTLSLLRSSIRDFWKLFAIAIPISLIAWGGIHLQNKYWPIEPPQPRVQYSWTADPTPATSSVGTERLPGPRVWKPTIIATARMLFIGVLLPLVMIEMWFTAMREGFLTAWKRIPSILLRSVEPERVLVFGVGALVFAIGPYFLLFKSILLPRATIEVALFSLRLVVVFALITFGWVVTMMTLARTGLELDKEVESQLREPETAVL